MCVCVVQGAAELLNEAREMDTADRYLNSKCVKYMLAADRIKDAEVYPPRTGRPHGL